MIKVLFPVKRLFHVTDEMRVYKERMPKKYWIKRFDCGSKSRHILKGDKRALFGAFGKVYFEVLGDMAMDYDSGVLMKDKLYISVIRSPFKTQTVFGENSLRSKFYTATNKHDQVITIFFKNKNHSWGFRRNFIDKKIKVKFFSNVINGAKYKTKIGMLRQLKYI